jgi:hypothetical protein
MTATRADMPMEVYALLEDITLVRHRHEPFVTKLLVYLLQLHQCEPVFRTREVGKTAATFNEEQLLKKERHVTSRTKKLEIFSC